MENIYTDYMMENGNRVTEESEEVNKNKILEMEDRLNKHPYFQTVKLIRSIYILRTIPKRMAYITIVMIPKPESTAFRG